ncbi:MAG: LuxR C-terminal-related transcriptional regulator, partial [Actinomycetota bacterium]|nr:LuxR C-terminal-related transcriptional regulator [Actinomycetota bacterium]
VVAGRALVEAGEGAAAEELLAPVVAAAGSNAPEGALQLARARRQLGRTDSARAALAQVGEGAGIDATLKAELRVEEARNHLLDWEPDRALATAQQVLDDPKLSQAPRARALLVVARAADQAFDARCLEHYGHARALARAGREPILALEILAIHARAVMAFGDAPGARRLVDEAIAEANALGQRRLELELRYLHSHLNLLEGSYDALAVESVALLEDPRLGGLAPRVRSDLAIVAADRGNDAQACDILDGVLEPTLSADSRATLLWTWAEVHWLAGRPAEAAADARACLAVVPTWATLARITLGWAAIDLGRCPPAPLEGPAYPLVAAARAESSGIAALGRPGGAPAAHRDLLRAAHERKGGYLRAELRCWWAAGEAAQRAGERDAAREHLIAVEARAQQHGFTALLGRIRRSLRGAGVPRPSPRGAPVGRLTHREHEVLRHVAAGKTSVRIAAELGISAATVDAHVRSAVRKLGARGRRHAALLAARGGDAWTSVAPLLLVAEGAGGTLRGAVDQLRAEGWMVQEGWGLPDVPWKLAQRRIACTGWVATGEEAVEVVLAALRGVALAVAVPDERLLERLAEDLHRIGDVQERTADAAQPLERLDAEQRRLLEALASGSTIEVAAQRLAWSRRTIDRRLAVIREVLGVSSTAEALMVLRGRPPA